MAMGMAKQHTCVTRGVHGYVQWVNAIQAHTLQVCGCWFAIVPVGGEMGCSIQHMFRENEYGGLGDAMCVWENGLIARLDSIAMFRGLTAHCAAGFGG